VTIVDDPDAPPAEALPPTVAQIDSWSRIDFGSLDDPFTDADLQIRLDRAIAYLEATTGRLFDDSMPGPLVPIAQEATQLRIEQMVMQEQEDYTETVNNDQVQSFTAGNYSESRRSPRDRYTGLTTGLPEINSNPWLNRDIWLLCTSDMRMYWTATLQGQSAVSLIPSFAVTEADWGNYDGLYPYSWGVGMTRPFPDANTWGA
jgi:hypothetical protein